MDLGQGEQPLCRAFPPARVPCHRTSSPFRAVPPQTHFFPSQAIDARAPGAFTAMLRLAGPGAVDQCAAFAVPLPLPASLTTAPAALPALSSLRHLP
jgi:hypothetical protein